MFENSNFLGNHVIFLVNVLVGNLLCTVLLICLIVSNNVSSNAYSSDKYSVITLFCHSTSRIFPKLIFFFESVVFNAFIFWIEMSCTLYLDFIFATSSFNVAESVSFTFNLSLGRIGSYHSGL